MIPKYVAITGYVSIIHLIIVNMDLLIDEKHHGMGDWEINLLDKTDGVESLRRREFFWQYELNTFQPNGLNVRGMAFF